MIYFVNDIELLLKLGKFKILDHILLSHIIAISAIKLRDYRFTIDQQIRKFVQVRVMDQDEDFPGWSKNKGGGNLTAGDLSTIYNTMQQEGSNLVISEQDIFIPPVARDCNVSCITEDDFVKQTISDERMKQIYNLVKQAS